MKNRLHYFVFFSFFLAIPFLHGMKEGNQLQKRSVDDAYVHKFLASIKKFNPAGVDDFAAAKQLLQTLFSESDAEVVKEHSKTGEKTSAKKGKKEKNDNDDVDDIQEKLKGIDLNKSPNNENSNSNSNSNSQETGEEKDQQIRYPLVYFSRQVGCKLKDVLLKLIHNEQKGIRGAFFYFMQQDVAQKLVIKHLNKISVSLIVDRCLNGVKVGEYNEADKIAALRLLLLNKIPVFCNKGEFDPVKKRIKLLNMHHKFLILENNINNKKLLLNGSYNCTDQAEENWENIMILDDEASIKAFEAEWDKLHKSSEELNVDQRLKEIAQEEKAREEKIKKFAYYNKSGGARGKSYTP